MTTSTVNLDTENPVTAKEAVALMLAYRRAGRSVMLWGDRGIGKTQLCQQLAAMIGARYIPFMTNVREPVDVRGLPVPNMEARTTEWLAPTELPKSDGSDGPTLLHADEINTGGMQMMAAMMQLVCEGRAGDHILPANCWIVASGNRRKDSRAVIDMPRPLKNKMAHLTMIADVPAWVDWAKESKLPAELIAFIRFRPSCLNQPDNGDENACATPRTIAWCADYINEAPHMRLKLFTGLVGKAVATEMEGFCSLYQSLTNIKDVLENPTSANVPTEASEIYAVGSAISRLAERKNFANVITYAKRLPRDIEAFTVMDAVARDAKLTGIKAYGEWAIANADLTAQA